MSGFKNVDGGIIIEQLIYAMIMQRDFLNQIDGKIGDGDHGTKIAQGFRKSDQRLRHMSYSFSDGLAVVAEVFLDDVRGMVGQLYGTIFDRISMAADDIDIIDAQVFSEMLQSANEGIKDATNAKIGDKTILDAMIPANKAFEKARRSGKNFKQCLNEMTVAAKCGMEATSQMEAAVGRAARLKGKSRGVLDAGAVSCSLMIESVSRSIQKII